MQELAADQPGADQTYSQLRRLIIEGHYAPGARLVEDRLARDLGVSRTPVRQALARVASEGLVQIFPNRGAVVRTFSREDLTEAYDLRAVLEGFAAFRAATRIDAAQLAELAQAATALERSLERQFATRAEEVHFLVGENQRFHGTIIAASGNARLPGILPAVLDVPLQYRSFNWYTREERAVSNFFHRRILDALQAHDADRARAMMQEHIYRGRDVLLESLNGTTP
jgi:DNA-binding GntR family transcriptional regulator